MAEAAPNPSDWRSLLRVHMIVRAGGAQRRTALEDPVVYVFVDALHCQVSGRGDASCRLSALRFFVRKCHCGSFREGPCKMPHD